jgi:pimeloyl-ACP methyl ester carboxylesterase
MLDKDTAATDDDAMVRIPPGRARIWRLTSLVGFCMSSTLSSAAHAGHCPSGPVIFVHGLEQDASIFDHMVVALTKLGVARECLHAFNYSGGNLPVQQAAEKELAPYVERVIAAERTPTRVNLVGHSMGALSARWFAARVRPERVRTWISTSGANHGTDWQCPQADDTGHGDLCPAFARNSRESAVQFALNGAPGPDVDETPYGLGRDSAGVRTVAADATRSILYLTVHVAADPFIKPNSSLLLDGAGGVVLDLPPAARWHEQAPGNFVVYTEPSGHDEVLRSDALADFVYRAISVVRPEPDIAATPTSDYVH